MAISEQLDLISKEIGGKLDDNGNIEQQVQEIYDIIKSGAWPSGGGESKVGIGFMDVYDGSGSVSSSDDEIIIDENAWVIISLKSTAHYVAAYTINMYIEDKGVYVPIISHTIAPETSGANKVTVPCKAGQNLKVDTIHGAVTVTYEKYTMGYTNLTIGS